MRVGTKKPFASSPHARDGSRICDQHGQDQQADSPNYEYLIVTTMVLVTMKVQRPLAQ